MMHRRILWVSLLALLVASGLAMADWEAHKAMFSAGEFQQLADMCEAGGDQIEADPGAHIIFKYCGLAELQLYEKTGQQTQLAQAIRFLEASVAYSYSEEAAFNLGLARMKALDFLSEGADLGERENEALNEMWDAMRNMHAMENFARPTLSDNLLIWSKDFRDTLIARVIKSEQDKTRLHLLAAQLRMLADRFELIDPTQGENEVRQGNLQVFKDWMEQLLEQTYFDNNIVVGMHKYKADRHMEKYDQTAETESEFTKALHFYGEALKRVRSNKARATLCADVAYLCSLFNSKNQEKLVSFYKIGFTHAREGLLIMGKINVVGSDRGKEEYPFEADSTDLVAKLQKGFGSNLTGLEYFHHLRKDFKSVVALKQYVFDTGFDWEGKDTTFLLIADAADKLATGQFRDRRAFAGYKELCLMASTRAFKAALRKHGGRPPQGDAEFCRVYQNHANYLRRFGEAIQARNLTLQYEASCAGVGQE
jgi:hypothetical protein